MDAYTSIIHIIGLNHKSTDIKQGIHFQIHQKHSIMNE